MSFLTRFVAFITVTSFISILTGTANSQPSQKERSWNLSGTWKLNVGYFDFRSDGSCTVKIPTGASGALIEAPMSIIKTASGYSVSVNLPTEIKVSGNRAIFVEQDQYGPLKWDGTLSKKVDVDRGRIVKEFSGIETCNSQATLPFAFKKESKPVYNFIYINGINTPRGNSNDSRGSCLSERRMVQQVLIDRTRIWDETSRLLETDCNLSGFDFDVITGPRVSSNGVKISVGDALQAFLQAADSKNPRSQSDVLSRKTIRQMRRILQDEEGNSQNNEKNYFIIVAHSQGNFFAEKIAGELTTSGSEIDQKLVKRLRIIAIASPTDYKYPLNTNRASTRVIVQHFTRCDDIILASLPPSRPLPANLPFPLKIGSKCEVPKNLSIESIRPHFLDEYFNSIPIVQKMTDRLIAEKRNLLYEDEE